MPISRESQAELVDVFVTMEAQLRCTPRYQAGAEGGRPDTNWQRFGRDVSQQLARMVSKASKDVLTTLPPKRDIVVNGRPAYDPDTPPLRGGRRPETLGMRLLEAAYRVRNNVIHGGKRDRALERYAGHDQQVVDASIEVVRKAIVLIGRFP